MKLNTTLGANLGVDCKALAILSSSEQGTVEKALNGSYFCFSTKHAVKSRIS